MKIPKSILSLIALAGLPSAIPLSGQTADCPDGGRFQIPSSGQSVKGQVMLLAIDDRSLPFRHNLVCYLSKPDVRREPVIAPNRDTRYSPDYNGTSFFGTVLLDQGKFRMWYYALHANPTFNGVVQGPVCYAESADGIHWTKPNLGQVEFHGSRDNNIIAVPAGADGQIECVGVIKDEDDPDPQRRYKLAYEPQHPEAAKYGFSLRTATSADGLHWTPGPAGPVNSFMEFSSFYKHDGLYVINAHTHGRGEGGRLQAREGYAWVSPDFNRWLPESAPSFVLTEPLVGSGERGEYVQDHEGVGGTDFGNVVVGLYCRWHQRPIPWGVGGIYSDLGLALSQDGIHFYEPVRDWVYISHTESPATPVPGKDYPTVLTPSNSVLDYGDKTLIYHGRWRNADLFSKTSSAMDYWCEVGLATLPRDRWGSLGPRPAVATPSRSGPGIFAATAANEGSVWSETVRLPSDRDSEVWLNADGANAMRVEIGDEQFNLLPDFSGANSGVPKTASGFDCRVGWGNGNLGSLRGKSIRLRVLFTRNGAADPRLYAVYLRKQ